MDQRLFFLINGQWSNPALDLPMAALSSWDFWWPIALLAGVLVFLFGGFRGRAALVCAGLAVGMTDGVVVDAIKNAVGRPRPHQVLEGVRIVDLQKARPRLLALALPAKVEYSHPSIQPVRGISFPSGHASNNFALAVVIAVFYRRWGWLYFIPATLISYSRIYTGSHYPSDTIVAMIIGAAVACLVLAACEALWRRFAERVAPRLFATHPSLLAG
ncbi:MAG: phosphatase PAP2 family protein [Terrimicrobiaceae bacterium]|nr:phosphatase PAP2 family protein [Terrimicrobiaceae bacterium]